MRVVDITVDNQGVYDTAYAEGVASVDITTDNQGVYDTAFAAGVASVDITTDNQGVYDGAFAAGVASVDITTDNQGVYDSAFADGVASVVPDICNLNGLELPGSVLPGIDLSSASMGGIDLSNSNLNGADFTDAMMNGANLEGSGCRTRSGWSIFGGGQLKWSESEPSSGIGTQFTEANLSNATALGANWSGADLSKQSGRRRPDWCQSEWRDVQWKYSQWDAPGGCGPDWSRSLGC